MADISAKDVKELRERTGAGMLDCKNALNETKGNLESAVDYLRKKGEMAILLVEQYFEFARDLADRYAVMERGQVVLSGTRAEMVETDVRRRLSV